MSEFFLSFIGLFRRKKKQKFIFPIIESLSPSSLFSLYNVSTFIFLLIIYNVCERRNYSDFYYHAPSWVRTRVLVVRRLERKPLTCETIPTTLRLLVTWPTAWDAPFSYEFYFEKSYCCRWNRFPTVTKQICFCKCRFYIAIYRWSLVIKNIIKPLF